MKRLSKKDLEDVAVEVFGKSFFIKGLVIVLFFAMVYGIATIIDNYDKIVDSLKPEVHWAFSEVKVKNALKNQNELLVEYAADTVETKLHKVNKSKSRRGERAWNRLSENLEQNKHWAAMRIYSMNQSAILEYMGHSMVRTMFILKIVEPLRMHVKEWEKAIALIEEDLKREYDYQLELMNSPLLDSTYIPIVHTLTIQNYGNYLVTNGKAETALDLGEEIHQAVLQLTNNEIEAEMIKVSYMTYIYKEASRYNEGIEMAREFLKKVEAAEKESGRDDYEKIKNAKETLRTIIGKLEYYRGD